MNSNAMIRLDKFLSNAGVLSRRGIKKLLKENKVTINNNRVIESGTRIRAGFDIIKINGLIIKKSQLVYFLLNKPMGVISTTADEMGRENVVSFIDTHERIYPVGRLDKDTHGLLILTNDGELTHKLIHPKYHVPKVYKLIVNHSPTPQQLKALRFGILLQDGITLPAEVSTASEKNGKTTLLITIHEGKNRQIRRMCEAVGLELHDLQRIAFGPLKLDHIKEGKYRKLTDKEISSLKQSVERK